MQVDRRILHEDGVTMKKQTQNKQSLVLNKERVRNLDELHLKRAIGGAGVGCTSTDEMCSRPV